MKPLLKAAIRKVLVTYQSKVFGLFSSTNIETYGYCNRKCWFCFNSDHLPNRDVGIMDESLFYKIIDELGEMHFAGRISPHFYGEVLLDSRIVDFVLYARKRNPYSRIRFSTNGDILTEKLLLELVENGLDKVLVTNYDDYEKPDLLELYRKHPEHMEYRSYKDITPVNRAGRIFDKKIKNNNRPCFRPSNQLVVNWKGNVLLCCNDYYEKYVFGNVKIKSILNIWNSSGFKKYRQILNEKGGRKEIDICKNCDL